MSVLQGELPTPRAELASGNPERPLRVAMVARELPPLGGGIGSYTLKTAQALASEGHDVHVFTEAHEGGARIERLEGILIHRLSSCRLRPREARALQRAWRVARALRRNGPFDVVHAPEWGGEAVLQAILDGARLVTRISTPHYLVAALNQWGRPDQWREGWRERSLDALLQTLERWQARRSRHIISPSRAMAELISRDWKIDPDRITVVGTGISIPPSNGSYEDPAGGAPYILYFGRLEVRKGVQTWMKALPAVLSRWPDLHAMFVGEDKGIGGRSFKDFCHDQNATYTGRVTFLDHMPHTRLFPLIRGARLVVLPSRWENLSNACLEAMALGRPIVATTGSAFEELIEEGTSGRLVPPDDAAALAHAVNELLAEPERLSRMGEAARLRAREFDIGGMVHQLVSVYRMVAYEAVRA